MYHQITNAIKVTVNPVYLEEQSSPSEAHYVWAYQVTIENLGATTGQLRNRVWSITDATGHTQVGPFLVSDQSPCSLRVP